MKRQFLVLALIVLPGPSWAQSSLAPQDMYSPTAKQVGVIHRGPTSMVKVLDKTGKYQGQVDPRGFIYDKQGHVLGNLNK